jgi:hypothetical protein
MERIAVRSITIHSIGYDPHALSLEGEFLSGSVYQYSVAPESIYQGLMNATSKGSYFHDHISDRYPTKRVR